MAYRKGGAVIEKREARGLLVDINWLFDRLGDPNLCVVDARMGDEYQKGHIPGALPLDVYQYILADTSPHAIEDYVRLMEVVLGQVGIEHHKRVVFYEENTGMHAARGVWLLEWMGHEDAHLLDGGLDAWKNANLPISLVNPPVAARRVLFNARLQRAPLATYQDVLERLHDPKAVILDVRSDPEYYAEEVRATRGGAIPGAVHVEWSQALDKEGCLRTPKELESLYCDKGVTKDKEIVTYCQGGFRAAHTYLALRLLGYPKVRNYIGSWREWGNRQELPIEVPKRD